MKNWSQRLESALILIGINPRQIILFFWGLPRFLSDWRSFRRQARQDKTLFPWGVPCPCLADRFEKNGAASGHYFHQDLLVARRIHVNHPERHIDVGSRMDGFVAHVASFRPIEVIDIRPLPHPVPRIGYLQADLLSALPDSLIASCDSLSCLHALEHFGLGRYGDPICFDGHLRGWNHLRQMLKPGGKFYFSTPIGPQRIEFNAHRVFAVSYLLNLFQPDFQVDQFSLVDDAGQLHENIELIEKDIQRNFGCFYGCGIFELTKTSLATA